MFSKIHPGARQPAKESMAKEDGKTPPLGQAAPGTEVFVGRQPILTSDQKLFSYELLFRHNATTTGAQVVDEVAATSRLLVNTFNNLGVEQVLGDKRAFINVSAGLLESDVIESLPPHKVVLEILESVEPSAAVVERCRALQLKGYQLALDDFVYRPEFEPLLKLASYVKLDIRALGLAETAQQVQLLRGRGLRMLAEKVETYAEFHACRRMLFTHYQGYYFARPETLSAKRIDPSTQNVMQLFNLVVSQADQSAIEAGFKQDVALTYNLLKYINSVGFGLAHTVETIPRALVVLGHKKLARWLSLLLMSGSKSQHIAPHALFRTALTRARMVELLGKHHLPEADQDYLFMTGMFSLLDTMLDKPLEALLADLTLPEVVRDALTHDSGRYAPFLQLACACEAMDLERIASLAHAHGMDAVHINSAHMQALAWTEEVSAGA
jgi:EAL and modified HD-GYP domain-containing signal transduction protein